MAATRRPIVGGNWKMNTNTESGTALARALGDVFGEVAGPDHAVEAFVCPPFPFLAQVGEVLGASGGAIALAAQDIYHEPSGAFTGEVSAAMLKDVGCSAVLLGHSERRHVIGERDELINKKTHAALEAGLTAVLCIGETLDQREAGKTDAVNKQQLTGGLEGVSTEQMASVVIAYEPVWAIGTGKTASADDAQAAHAAIREVLANLYDQKTADATRIQYGGSCKPSNAAELFAQPDIDGGLIGGAALKAGDFLDILRAAAASNA
jgi:triosephosphate isomerase